MTARWIRRTPNLIHRKDGHVLTWAIYRDGTAPLPWVVLELTRPFDQSRDGWFATQRDAKLYVQLQEAKP